MILSDIRNYEVSIWTLQDGFISVLKYATLENKGQIQQPELKIVDDGTQEFTFKIPMYIMQNGEMIQNPIWYNTTNGVLVASTRKIKVIVNKKDAVRILSQQRATQDEEVFEFIITKVVQTHQDEILTCEVTCQGLAFHELGKIGYKFSLSQQDFFNEYSEWANATDEQRQQLEEPHATIQYWNDKIFNNLKYWTYQINMNWEGYLFKDEDGTVRKRDTGKVYEDTYVSSWDKSTGMPKIIEQAKEKQRLIDSSESNVYNLTQTIAQNFGVYCKYVYQHDNNYNIINRKVVYYNNFLNQKYGALDLTYPYNTSSITRQMDSTNLVTKMYVKPANSDTSRDGFITILSTPANRSGEDYLLNFDYMHTVGSITDQQYNEVFLFQNRIAKINEQLEPLGQQILKLNQTRINVQADSATYDRGRKLAEERYTQANALVNSITKDTGVLHVTAERPTNGVLLQDTKSGNNTCYLNVSQTGIIPETFHMYKNYSYSATGKDKVSNQIFGTFQFDQFNNLIKVTDIIADISNSRSVYLTYDYQPLEYAKRVKSIWKRKKDSDQAEYRKAITKLEKIDTSLEEKNEEYNQLLLAKQQQIQAFQSFMGPALRQGYWLPDQYNDYGDKLEAVFTDGFTTGERVEIQGTNQYLQDSQGNYQYSYDQNYTDDNGYATPIWDSVPFSGQQLPYYESGINQDKIFYPCIKLTSQQLQYIQKNDNVYLNFYDLKYNQTEENYRSFAIGSECQLGLLKDKNNSVFPILIVVGAKDMTDQQIENMQSGGNNNIIYQQLSSMEKQVTYPPTESTTKISSQLSEKIIKQLIITTDINDEKIAEKTVVEKYEIITQQIQQNTPSVTPSLQPQETITTTQQKVKVMGNITRGKNSTSTKSYPCTSNQQLKLSNYKLSFEIKVKSGYWAYAVLTIKKDNRVIYSNSNQCLSSGINRINCNGTYNFETFNGLIFQLTLKDREYSLVIENIDAIITGSGKTAKISEYKLTPKKMVPKITERIKQVNIQEKNLFHQNPIQVVFNIEYDENEAQPAINVTFNGNEINGDSYNFIENFIQDNSYTITQAYTIDRNNKRYTLNQRIIQKGNNVNRYLETFGVSTIEITDTRFANAQQSFTTKTITTTVKEEYIPNQFIEQNEEPLEQEQENENNTDTQEKKQVTIRLFDIITSKYSLKNNGISTQACLKAYESNDLPVAIAPKKIITPKINLVTKKIDYTTQPYDGVSDWLDLEQINYGQIEDVQSNQAYFTVYPRIQINSLKLKQSDIHLSVLYNNRSLVKYEDYSLLTRNNKYYITLKIEKLLEIGKYMELDPNQQFSNILKPALINNRLSIPELKLYYCLSNADTAIYLDGIQVLKESAFPKVSYQIDVNMINPDFIRTIYNKMGYIAHINDNQLKFENVLGYISEITMHLDKPWEDQIIIKNYKTDFENLFSTIVASTQAMKKNAYIIGLAAGAFDSTGNLSIEAIEQALTQRGLMFNFNNGRLTINQKDGILGISQSGIINFRCNGIFTSSQKDEDGNWIWNTAITPNGINADLITTGQLDTNLVRIFAGDKLRFQLNNQGLFGYKSFLEDLNGKAGIQHLKNIQSKWSQMTSIQKENYNNLFQNYLNSFYDQDGYTELQYIKFNENGLFLTAQKNATVYTNNEYIILDSPVTRVQVSWDGLKLRNWNNDEVFWADPDTGNLYITGTVFADSFKILGSKADLNDQTIAPMPLNDFITFKFEDHVKISPNLEYIFNAAGDIIKRAWSSLDTLEGTIVQNAQVLNNFLEKAKQMPHEPIQLVTGSIDENTGEESTVSALVLHPTQGIWMGSTNKITFYSGDTNPKLVRNDITGEYEETLDGAAVTIDKNQILLGVSNISESSSNSGAVQITSDKIVLAVGGKIGTFNDENQQPTQTYTSKIDYDELKDNSSISGIVITKESIGLATQINNQRNLILMDQNGIIIGTANDVRGNIISVPKDGENINYTIEYDQYSSQKNYQKDDIVIYNNSIYRCIAENQIQGVSPSNINSWTLIKSKNGSFVKISRYGIIIGSDSNLYINTSNALLQTAKITNNEQRTVFGLGYNVADWSNLKFFKQTSDFSNTSPITSTTNSSTGIITQSYGNVSGIQWQNNVSGDQDWKLFFDGENLHIKGFLYAKNIRIMTGINSQGQPNDGNGYTLQDYLHYEYQTRTKVSNELKNIFTTAGNILQQTGQILTNLDNVTTYNNTILEDFFNKVKELQPDVYRSTTKPTTFKPGDIWEPNDGSGNRYIAMSFSSESGSAQLDGWNKVYDGSLASITGAGLDIDAVEGTIDLYAGSKISLKAKSQLQLVSGDIQITGNHSINIGSKWVNIGSENGGINIISTNINDDSVFYTGNTFNYTSSTMPSIYNAGELWENTANNKIYKAINTNSTSGNGSMNDWKEATNIYGTINKIQLSKDGIIMHGSIIQLMAGNTDNVAALQLDPTKGIWMGTSEKILFFSSNISSNTSASGASVEISKEKILFGVSSGANTTATEMTNEYIIFATGNRIDQLRGTGGIDWTEYYQTGVKITKDGFWIASGSTTSLTSPRALVAITPGEIKLGTSSNNSGSYVEIKQTGITIGTSSNITLGAYDSEGNGSFVRVQTNGIKIGSNSNMWISTNNFILDTQKAGINQYDDDTQYAGDTQVFVGHNLYKRSDYNSTSIIAGQDPTSNGSNYWNLIGPSYAFKLGDQLKYSPGKLTITGDITATSFTLSDTSIVAGNNNYDISAIANVPISTVTYYLETSSANQPNENNAGWTTNRPSTITKGTYLWIKKVNTYINPTTGQSYTRSEYSCEYYPNDGTGGGTGAQGVQGISLISSIQLYKLATSLPDPPTSSTQSSWSTTVPTYISNYTYYVCFKQTWSDPATNTAPIISYTNPVANYGLTVANANATTASQNAADIVGKFAPIETYGLAGLTVWKEKTYGLVLGNNSSYPMLIGSNSGITIANNSSMQWIDSNGYVYDKKIQGSNNDFLYHRIGEAANNYHSSLNIEIVQTRNDNGAIVLDSSGIALNGASLNFTAANGSSVITLNSGGINMAALGEVMIQGNQGFIQFGTEDNSGGDINFKVDKDGNVYCKKLICQDIRTDNLSYVKKQDSATGNTSGQYTLYYFGNVDKKYGYSGHTRTAVFKLLNGSNLQTGTYQIILDWWLISSDNPLGRYTISATTNLDSTRTLFSLVGNDNVYSRAKDIKITGGSNSGIALNGNMGSSPSTFTFYIYNTTDSITFNIYMNYDGGNSGLYGTMWNMSRTDQKQNTIILNKIS